MSREGLRRQWQKRMRSFARSGLSQRAWCEREGIGLAQFGYWRRRLAKRAAPDIDEGFWCPVELVPEPSPRTNGIAVRVGKVCIEVQPDFDGDLLRAVVQALEPLSC